MMSKSLKITVVVLAASIMLLTASCAQDQSGDVRAAIEATTAQWQQSFNAGDAAGIAALYTADGQLLPPGAATISGRDDIEAFWQGFVSIEGISAVLESGEIVGQGNHATEIGRYTMTDADGNTIEQGKYMVLWRRDQGVWQLARDIWNANEAPAADTGSGD
jgi:uncharacterized protein (TIGR02246 family)